MKSVTVVITSFNRFECLIKTINSFKNLNTYPIERFLVIDDSTNKEFKDKCLSSLSNDIELIFNEQILGQPASIDKAYSTITTEYIFHSEDDYIYSGNSNFIKDSIDILEERKDRHQIWIRHFNDLDNAFKNSILEQWVLDPSILKTTTNVTYREIKVHFDWAGFSWNPGLRRAEDYKNMFPNGYASVIPQGAASSLAEAFCDHHARDLGYRAAYLINSACADAGKYISTYKADDYIDGWKKG